jgi:hypothetical protein
MIETNFISGDFTGRWHPGRHGDAYVPLYSRRILVEECESISMSDIRNRFGRKELLNKAECEGSLRIQHGCRYYEIGLSAERYQQKWRRSGWSDITRVWLHCSCGRRARKLYIDPRPSGVPAILACRTCHRLRYLAQNSGKTKWFRRIVKPFRKLIRRQEKLFALKRTQRVRDELEFIQGQLFVLMQRATPKHRGSCSGIRRRYRDVRLLFSPA